MYQWQSYQFSHYRLPETIELAESSRLDRIDFSFVSVRCPLDAPLTLDSYTNLYGLWNSIATIQYT